MMKKITAFFSAMALLLLAGCVTVDPPKPVVVSGAATYMERIGLPAGAVITIAIVDLDTPGVILSQKTFETQRVPVPFKFIVPAETIDANANYGVVASINFKGQVLFQTYNRYPVINNEQFTAEVIMKPQSR